MREQGSHRVELPPRWRGRQVAGSILSRCSYPLTSSARSTHLHTRHCTHITYTGGNITYESVKPNVTFASVPFFPQIIWMEVDWSAHPRWQTSGRTRLRWGRPGEVALARSPGWRRPGGGARVEAPRRGRPGKVARQDCPARSPVGSPRRFLRQPLKTYPNHRTNTSRHESALPTKITSVSAPTMVARCALRGVPS